MNAYAGWALGILAAVLAGLILASVKRRWDRDDEQAKKDQTDVIKELTGLGLRFECEREERHAAVGQEADIRRDKDDAMGRDISAIREEFAYFMGQMGKERPKFTRRQGGSD